MIIRQCPITGGMPTRIWEHTFKRLCHYHKFLASRHTDRRYGRYIASSVNTYCHDECTGPPPELTLEKNMAKKKETPELAKTLHGGADGEVAQALAILAADRDVDTLVSAASARMAEINELRGQVEGLTQSLASTQAELDWQAENTSEPGSMRECIEVACSEMCNFLIAKNASYGNSVADPVRLFSRADPPEAINIRIDDKLSRMLRGHGVPTDNDEIDLLGYLLLKQAVMRWQSIQPC